MSKTNDEQVAAILARGVARVRAMEYAGEPTGEAKQDGHITGDETASSDQEDKTQSEATR